MRLDQANRAYLHDNRARLNGVANSCISMRKVASVGCPHSGDLLAALNIFPRIHQHLFDMGIIRLHIFALAIFEIGVQQGDYITPSRSALARQQHAAIRDRVNWLAQIAVFTADTI